MTPKDKFIPEIWEMKHIELQNKISELKELIDEVKIERHKENNEIKDPINKLSDKVEETSKNLKNKIFLTEKSLGEKIDELNDYDETLKGNGEPGIWESIRSIRRNIKILIASVVILSILSLGGNFRGVSKASIDKAIQDALGKQKKTQVAPNGTITRITQKSTHIPKSKAKQNKGFEEK